ncbi:replicative DNA helicase [Orientia tsutsugamushi]|uniref:Replicative DNA helicase n=1 Tax=Orientia tsutsugamushi TaxID=784 RepID=A0A2U3R516_ORITS|nr:replicative DNA helicase [Orientia tsutsugamushi]
MPEIKLNLRPNLLRLFRYLSAIILNYLNQFRKRSNKLTEVYDKSNINKENCKKDVREYKDLKKKGELNMITLERVSA